MDAPRSFAPVILIVAVLVLAALAGFWAQRRLLGWRSHDDPLARTEGLPVSELVIPVRTLPALLLAFVLFSVYGAYEDAGDSAAVEAGAVLSMAQDAVLLTPVARRDVLGQLQCYARSVAGPDWRAQAEDGQLSPIADAAADGITGALVRATADERNTAAVAAIRSDDGARIQARIQRIDEGRPTVPAEVWALLLVTVAIMVGGLAALAHPGVRQRVQLAVLVGTAVVFGLTLLVVHDLDHPYDGPAKIEPAAMRTVERRITALPDGDAVPACDADGRLR